MPSLSWTVTDAKTATLPLQGPKQGGTPVGEAASPSGPEKERELTGVGVHKEPGGFGAGEGIFCDREGKAGPGTSCLSFSLDTPPLGKALARTLVP